MMINLHRQVQEKHVFTNLVGVLWAAILVSVFITPGSAEAEYLGTLPGREATPARTTEIAVDLALVNGDLGGFSYQNIAARASYHISPELTVLGTVGIAEYGPFDGVPVGLGALYHLSNQRISQRVEIAGKASFHFGEFSQGDTEGDLTSLSLEVLISGAEPILQSGLAWYAHGGYHRISVDFGNSDSTHEIGLGAGLVLPTGLGEFYVGAEHIEDLSLGLGIRYFVQ